jgi:hypothetical protein
VKVVIVSDKSRAINNKTMCVRDYFLSPWAKKTIKFHLFCFFKSHFVSYSLVDGNSGNKKSQAAGIYKRRKNKK